MPCRRQALRKTALESLPRCGLFGWAAAGDSHAPEKADETLQIGCRTDLETGNSSVFARLCPPCPPLLRLFLGGPRARQRATVNGKSGRGLRHSKTLTRAFEPANRCRAGFLNRTEDLTRAGRTAGTLPYAYVRLRTLIYGAGEANGENIQHPTSNVERPIIAEIWPKTRLKPLNPAYSRLKILFSAQLVAALTLILGGCGKEIELPAKIAPPEISIYKAATDGNMEQLQRYFAQGTDVNQADQYSQTPLLLAIQNGRRDVVAVLLDHGAKINGRDAVGNTPLHQATGQGQRATTPRCSSSRGADVNATNKGGVMPFHIAVAFGFKDLVTAMLEKHVDVNVRTQDGDTPLSLALGEAKARDVAELLLQHGADVNLKNGRGQTPLMMMIADGFTNLSAEAVAKGADVNAKGSSADTPLLLAVKKSYEDLVALLLEKGASITNRDSAGDTALHVAVKENSPKAVGLLLQHGADGQRKGISSRSLPALHAALHDRKELAGLLIAKGANVNARDNWKRTPLHSAVEKKSLAVAEVLVAKGADVNARDNKSQTPLAQALVAGEKEMVALLKKSGAN